MTEEPHTQKNTNDTNESNEKEKKEIPNTQYKVFLEDNKDDIYDLQIGIKSKFIFFKLFQNNNIELNYYSNKYELNEIINILNLPPLLYNSLEKVKKIIDDFFSKKIFKLQKEKNKIVIIFKIPIFFQEIESKIELNNINLDADNILFEKMINLNNKVNANEEIISQLKEKNNQLEEKLEKIEKRMNEIENLNKLLIVEKMKDLNNVSEKRKKEIDEKLNHKFTKNPQNLKYKMDICSTNDYFGRNDIFEVFISVKDLKSYLISKNTNYNLDIYSLESNTLIKSIKHHTNRITMICYFLNEKTNREYLVTADENKMVTLWDIHNDFNIIYDIKTGYSGKIYSSLLVFNIEDKNYLLASTNGTNDYIKIYNIDSGVFIDKINKSINNYTYYLLYWFNKKIMKIALLNVVKVKF